MASVQVNTTREEDIDWSLDILSNVAPDFSFENQRKLRWAWYQAHPDVPEEDETDDDEDEMEEPEATEFDDDFYELDWDSGYHSESPTMTGWDSSPSPPFSNNAPDVSGSQANNTPVKTDTSDIAQPQFESLPVISRKRNRTDTDTDNEANITTDEAPPAKKARTT